MQGSKITLSPSELSLFCDAEVILTKNTILQKTVTLLAGVQEQLMEESLSAQLDSSPKISRGENYLGLPWVVLDYPRLSSGKDLLFIRSMFWWGHFFSSTLQLAGQHKDAHLSNLVLSHGELAERHCYVGTGEDPWQHHFESTNYQKINSLSQEAFAAILQQQPHIKIAARWPLSEWDVAANLLTETWKYFTGLVA